MKRPRPFNLVFLSLCTLALILFVYPAAADSVERSGIQAAWERAREAGSYRFSADIVQKKIPLPTVTNVGRQSRQNDLHIEGRTNLPERALDFTLWSHGGSVLNLQSGVEVRAEDDRAFARQGTGPWEEINDFTGLFAPDGDFMVYLAAAKDVVEQGTETRAGITFTRYTFRIDGASYAAYARDQLQQHLTEKGELPPGVELDLPRQYAGMTGRGELWVEADGLPLRQVLHLEFPEQNDERVEAQVVVTFSDFGKGDAQATPSPLLALFPWRGLLQQAALFVGTTALVLIIAVHRRSKKLYVAVVLTVITSVIVTPLLQSVQAARFVERQAARMGEQESRAEESEALRMVQEELLAGPKTSTPSGPAALALIEGDVGADTDRDGLTDVQEMFLGTNLTRADRDDLPVDLAPLLAQTGADFDRDGLTDYQERLLGTNPQIVDTDGDMITDTLEIAGFVFTNTAGITTTYYTDPSETDTNRDGIGDGREWYLDRDGNGLPDDTDGDGVPDLFDRDNDGDGVPDDLDLSPYETTRGDPPFDEDNPFSLIIDNLTPGKLTYVEFQIRPVITDHLWYAYNVLDWPDGDKQGTVHDADGGTFSDNENGDIKLLPMLEIVVSGTPDNLPPASDLEDHYGIFIQGMQGDGAERAVYVPLQLATEDDSGARVAFYGKMLYLPTGSWGDAQRVRLVWVVQALVDECGSYSLGDTDGDGQEDFSRECQSYSKYNQVQILHTYDDEWYLTGLNVRENHGVDVGVIYEDPWVDDDLNDDEALVMLTHGLDYTFLAGRDLDEDGQRDVSVAELYRRFDHHTNTGVPSEQRWGVTNILAVTTATYSHQDEALATTAITVTPSVLAGFTPFATTSLISPTLLFVREDRYRAISLDAAANSGAFTWDGSGRQLTIDMDAGDGLPVQTAAAVKWAPYRYRGGDWESYPIEIYWDELVRRYADEFDDVSNPTEARGMLVYFQLYYMGLYTGLTSVVQAGGLPLIGDLGMPQLSEDVQLTKSMSRGAGACVRFVVNTAMRNLSGDAKLVFQYLGMVDEATKAQSVGDINPGLFKSLRYIRQEFRNWRAGQAVNKVHVAAGVVALVAVGVLIVGAALLIAAQFNNSTSFRIAGTVLVGTVLVGLQIVIPLITVARLIRAAVKAGETVVRATSAVLRSSSAVIGVTKVANVVGLVLMVGIAWGFFIYQVVEGGVSFGSIAFNQLLARAIADTIIAVLMFVLSATVIGAIIVAIFTLIDLLLHFLIDFSVTDWIADKIAKAIYTYEVMVDPKIDSGGLDMRLVDPGMGMVAGNQLVVTMTLTTTVTHKDTPDPRVIPYLWKYTDSNLRSTTFKHLLDSTAYSVSASEDEMYHQWQVSHDHSYIGHSMRRGVAKVNLVKAIPLQAGTNVTLPLHLNTGYSLPGLSCWMIPIPPFWYPILPVCIDKTIGDSAQTDVGSSVVLDVLPNTLDGFYALDWGDFAVQRDHDGDGLISVATGGNDPDDTTWDTDGDGLSDTYELARRSMADQNGGVRPSALNKDTDGDGLCDPDEIRWGTLPQRRDSDGDGMNDGDEVFHRHCVTGDWVGGWTFEYGVFTDTYGITHTLTTRVTSDPTSANTDGDALNDLAERTLSTHPRAFTPSPIALRTEVDDSDGIVAPGQTFVFTATVENQIEHDPPLFFLGGVTATLPVAFSPGGVHAATFNVYRNESASLSRDLTVDGGVSSGEATILTQVAGDMHDGDLATYWKWDDPQPVQDVVTTLGVPGHARIDAALNLASGQYAVASTERGKNVNLRHAEAVFSGSTGVVSDSRRGPGAGVFPPGVACADDGKCLTVWGYTHYYTCTWVYFDRLYCLDDYDVGDSAEFFIRFNGSTFFDQENIDTGETRTINRTLSFCNSAIIQAWEDDWGANPDDYMGSHTIEYWHTTTKAHFIENNDSEFDLYFNIHLTEWDGIYGAIVTATRAIQTPQFGLSEQGPEYRYRRNPVAASDGADFMTVWQEWRGENEWDIYARKVYSSGSLGSIVAVTPTYSNQTNPAVAWVGDKYMILWERAVADSDVEMAYVDAQGQYITSSSRPLIATFDHEARPQIAYNPHTKQALVVYVKNLLDVTARLVDVQTLTVSDPIHLGSGWDQVGSLAVANEPKYRGWLVSWDTSSSTGGTVVHYVPLSSQGEILMDKQGLGAAATHSALHRTLTFPQLSNQDVACSRQVELDPDVDYAQCAIVAASSDRLFLQPLGMEDVSPWLGRIEVTTDTVMWIDADPPTSTIVSLANGQYLGVTGTLIIGGEAHDPGPTPSGIATVEVSENGGAMWNDATGAESWAYAWDVPQTDGPVTLQTRAADLVGNVEQPPTAITVHVDHTPPNVTITNGGIVSTTRSGEGRWQVHVGGTVGDAGSGPRSVEVWLTPHGSSWQAATMITATGDWALDYVLPKFGSDGRALTNPTGLYTILARATDAVGNQSVPVTRTLRVDSTPPVASVTNTGPSTNTITQTITVNGVITDPGSVTIGVQSLDVSFTPAGANPTTWQAATVSSPGAITSTWQRAVPAGLEGVYQIDLRGTDALGNRNDDPSTWQQWQGEVDTQAPRTAITVTYRGAQSAAQTVVEGWAEDFNLIPDLSPFPCPLQAADRHYYDDAWWNDVTDEARRLYRLTPSCILNGFQVAGLQACDRYSRCTPAAGTGLPYTPPLLASAVLTPGHESVLATTTPVNVTVGAYAVDALRALTFTVNGGYQNGRTWATNTVTDTLWPTLWDPPDGVEGHYRLSSEVRDWSGQVRADLQPITVVVDTQDPSITIGSTVLTTAHRLSFGRVPLTGAVTDTVGLEAVDVSVDGGAWAEAAFGGGSWRFHWYLGEEPNGATYTVAARATDGAGRTATANDTVVVDLVPPSPVTVTLAYTDSLGARQALSPGQTISRTPVDLIAEWTQSGNGLDHYRVGWTESPTVNLAALTVYAPAAPRHYTLSPGEAEARYAHVVALDARGNQQAQMVGPIYVDTPLTPDYVVFPPLAGRGEGVYHGWMESGCSQIGADREVARSAYTGASLDDVQRMYLTWDGLGLRLTWVGANWNVDGDLFVYLDTAEGQGSMEAYDPYGNGPTIHLPAQGGDQLAADHMIWVEDEETAHLLHWNGSGWDPPMPLDAAAYQLDIGLLPPHTDLLIPWVWLGSPASLELVALASEEDALRIWATMPDKNALNSKRVANPVAWNHLDLPFTLTQQYEWPAFGSGVCPNEGRFADADLHVSLTANPPGVEVGFLEHDLPGLLVPGRPLDGDLDGDPDVALPMDVRPALLGNGEPIVYTLSYTNTGAVIAPGATVTIASRGGVVLVGGSPQVFHLNGAGGVIQIAATVNAALDGESAEVDAVVADATHGSFDWLWVQHDVDTVPPEGLAIQSPLKYANSYTNTVRGSARDPSGVPLVMLDVREVGGITTSLVCPDATPYDGLWSCVWNAQGAADSTQFDLLVKAADRFGNTNPDWTAPHRVVVDATPPTITLSADTQVALGDGLLVLEEIDLTGQVQDDRQADQAEICVAQPGEVQDCLLVDVIPGGTPTIADWYAQAPIAGSGDGSQQVFSFYGLDSVGNRSSALEVGPVRVDVVGPEVEVVTALAGVVQATYNTVLTGTVRDGSGVEAVRVHVAKPDGIVDWHTGSPTVTLDGDTWRYAVRFDDPGSYSLGVEARDVVSNVGGAGPFDLTVYEASEVADISLASQTASSDPAITGRPLTYTFTIGNAGPGNATTSTLTIKLPAAVSPLWTSHDCSESAGDLFCDLGDLNVGAVATVTVRVYVPLTTTWKLICTASVESSKVDLRLSNNQKTLYTSIVQPVTGLAATADSPTVLGEITTLTATIATGTDVRFTWSLGDGKVAAGSVVTHVYPTVAVYTAVVTAANTVDTVTATTRITTDIPIATPLLAEDFEGDYFPSPGWLRTIRIEDQRWQQDISHAHSGFYSAFYDDFFGTQDGWLITPQVTPTIDSELTFWQFENYARFYHRHSIWISTGSGDPKDGDFVERAESRPGMEELWEEVRLDLTDYAGQPIYLAFRYEGDFADEWFIDDVQVTTGLVLSHDGPALVGQTTTMTASVATGSNVIYDWDFGDGSTARIPTGRTGTGAVVTHTYLVAGNHTVVVSASNSVSMLSGTMIVPVTARLRLPLVVRNYTLPCPDSYEPDDTPEQASAIATNGIAQRHTFHQAADTDWITFEVISENADYVIETFDLQDADTVIYLYDSDRERLLDWNDDAQSGIRASRLHFNPYHAGTFYIRIVNYDSSESGCAVRYSVRITAQR